MQACQRLNMFERGEVAIDGSKFKAVNNRDKMSLHVLAFNMKRMMKIIGTHRLIAVMTG